MLSDLLKDTFPQKRIMKAVFLMAFVMYQPSFGIDQSANHLKKRLKLEKKLRESSYKDCDRLYDRFVEKRAKDANALCRPGAHRPVSRDAKATLVRLQLLKKEADTKWHYEKGLDKQGFHKSPAPHEQRTVSYNLLTQHLFSQYAMQCGRFNDQFSDALILINQVFPKCRKNLRFESYRHDWRSNTLQNIVYKENSNESRPSHLPPSYRSPASLNNR